ncbi:MAG: hypothetical protein LUD79_00055 [Oscillospiraceae bacterium]|nr:hypothetical protein [Oscillospiraceae bacterium]
MTGIENITGRIQADAQAQIDQVNQKADAQVAQIRDDYQKRTRQETDEILRKGRIAAEEREKRLVSAAQMESKKMTLAAKQEVIEEAFALALEQLCKLPEQDTVALLASLIVKASSTGSEQVILNQADRTRYGVKACQQANAQLEAAGKTGNITLSEQVRDIRGGLLLKNGAVEVNCAYETLVRLVRSEATGEVSKVLFD